jgi:hypothetical protein
LKIIVRRARNKPHGSATARVCLARDKDCDRPRIKK